MVGPLDGKYYCTNEMFGYCDRRTGTCFCNGGYTGLDCGTCRPTHFLLWSDAAKTTYTCAQKKRCPNDCSGGGDCNFATGKCVCKIWRTGEACEKAICSTYDDLCVRCDTERCWECAEGYYVNSTRTQNVCGMCTKFDPRCLVCNEAECLVCTDPLLRSVRRSGRRRLDPEQPLEDFYRELAITLPFGSQRPEAFDEAEPFQISSTPDRPLRGSSVGCTQGLVSDRQWHCESVEASHKVCGHVGTLAFNSPEYQVAESAGHLLVTVFRTGGGVGETSVDYAIRYSSNPDMGEVEASTSDVTPTAHYTSSQTLTFAPGVVRLRFKVTIHSDVDKESNETFTLGLSNPTGGATLGPQSRCIVTIIDDDTFSTDPPMTFCTGIGVDPETYPEALASNQIQIQTVTADGKVRTGGNTVPGIIDPSGDVFWYEVWDEDRLPDNTGPNSGDGYASPPPGLHQIEGAEYDRRTSRKQHSRAGIVYESYVSSLSAGLCVDANDETGTHRCDYVPPRSGNFSLAVRLVTSMGLVGEYFDNPFLQDRPVINRVDRVVNFTWGTGAVTTNGRDFVSARWHGKISTDKLIHTASSPQIYRMYLLADDHTRLWIDGTLLIDTWDCDATRHPEVIDRFDGWIDGAPSSWDELQPCSETSGDVLLTPSSYHDIRIEFRELRGRGSVRLMWKSDAIGLKKTVVPPEYLYQVRHVKGSPFPIEVQPSQTTSATATYPAGTGLLSGTVGDNLPFKIVPNDANYNARGLYARFDQYEISASVVANDHGGVGPREVSATGSDFVASSGTFSSTYRTLIAGTYDLAIKLITDTALAPIAGSPYRVIIHPSAAVGGTSQAFGSGLLSAVAGDDAHFTVRLRDQFQNIRRDRNTVDFSLLQMVAVHHVHEEMYNEKKKEIVDINDATYSFVYVANRSGVVELNIKVSGDHVATGSGSDSTYNGGSPYSIEVSSSIAAATTSTAIGWALKEAVSSVPSFFIITIRDRFQNLRYEAGHNADAVTCDIRPAVANNADVDVTNQTVQGIIHNYFDATYRCTYVPRFAGTNRLEVRVAGEHIDGSPFLVEVADGLSKGANSTARGDGFWIGSTAGYLGHFTVQSVDEHGNHRNNGPGFGNDTFHVSLTHSDPSGYYVDTVVKTLGASLEKSSTTSGQSGVVNVTQITGACDEYLGEGRYSCIYNASIKGTWDLSVTLHDQHITASPRKIYIKPAEVDAHVSLPALHGLTTGVAGHLSHLSIQAKDRYGNNRTNGGDIFSVRLVGVGPLSTPTIQTQCMSEHDLRWSTDKYNGWIHSLPAVHECVESVATHYDSSLLGGTDLIDDEGLPLIPMGMVEAASEGWGTENGDDSTYNGSYIPLVAGRFHLDVLCNGTKRVSSSPYSLTVVPDSTNGSSSYALGPGLFRATSSIQTSFTIQARDMYGNPQIHDQDQFYVVATRGPTDGRLASPGQSVYSGEKQPQFRPDSIEYLEGSQGQYRVRYTPTDAGTFLLRASLLLPGQAHDDYGLSEVQNTLSELGSELEGSPFVVRVSDGRVEASTSHAYGVGLTHTTAGVQAFFTIQARDEAGNNRTTGGDSITVTIRHEESSTLVPSDTHTKIEYLINGSYRVHYNATVAGNTTVDVHIGAKSIHGSPFRPYVSPSVAHAANCHAQGVGLSLASTSGSTTHDVHSAISNVTVYARDRFGNLLDRGGDQFVVKLIGPTSLYVRLQDLGRGLYYSEYIPSFISGAYDLSVDLLHTYMNGGGGLLGEFYHDHSYSKLALERVDATVDTAILPLYKSVRYSGYVVPVGTGPYHFEVRTNKIIRPRLRVNGIQIVDIREGYETGSRNGTIPLIGGIPYKIILELSMLEMEIGSVQLLWSGAGLPGIDSMMRLIPKSRLSPSANPVSGSPFRVQIT